MADVEDLLRQAGIPTKDRGTGVGREHINFQCPYCLSEKHHLGVHEDEGWFLCWRCNEKGQWGKLARKLRKQYPTVDWFSFRPTTPDRYIEDLVGELATPLQRVTRDFVTYDVTRMHNDDLEVWEYLVCDRGLEPWVIRQVRPGIGMRGPEEGDRDLRGYVTFRQGEQLVARAMGNFEPRWWKSSRGLRLWGLPWIHAAKPSWVVICEGVFDAIACPIGHGLAILGAVTSTSWLDEFTDNMPAEVRTVILALDPGIDRNSEVIKTMRLNLTDAGFDVKLFDWQTPALDKLVRRDRDMDLDRLRLHSGRDFVLEHLLHTSGVIDVTDTGPLL